MLEQTLQDIDKELNTTPLEALELVKNLPKAQDFADFQAKVDYLLKENGELRSQVAIRKVQLKEAEALKTVAFEDLVCPREHRDKAVAIFQKFHNFVGHPSDVVNKALLYNKSMGQPRVMPAPKVIRCLVDYNAKMERLLKEMRTLLQLAEQQQALESSEH